jgi:predicted O-methyltransferase YrrM
LARGGGSSPLVLGKALADNAEGGIVTFIDPSLVDDTWTDPENVKKRFQNFGVENVVHHRATTQEFVETDEYRSLGELGIVFIDGNHTEEQARFDYEAFADRVPPDGMILLHGSVRMEESSIYGEDQTYRRTVKLFVDELKQNPTLQVFDVPFQDGLTLVRRTDRKTEPHRPTD